MPLRRPDRRAPAVLHVPPASARAFGRLLRKWFRTHGRDLPWRRTRDPYAILVSELMLQQTQVVRVLDYWPRFLARFPRLSDVASASTDEVTAAWSGLGYYARARNLHALALRVTRDGGDGTLPATPSALRELPGVGAYTAGAVASFAYERRAPLVDTNVARVLSRVFAPHLHPKRSRDQRILWEIAEGLLPRDGRTAWTHNQALMELGALVCGARVRRCAVCPVRSCCASVRDQAPPPSAAERPVGRSAAGAAGAPPRGRHALPAATTSGPTGRSSVRRCRAGTPPASV